MEIAFYTKFAKMVRRWQKVLEKSAKVCVCERERENECGCVCVRVGVTIMRVCVRVKQSKFVATNLDSEEKPLSIVRSLSNISWA
jgi:hypothetical protein